MLSLEIERLCGSTMLIHKHLPKRQIIVLWHFFKDTLNDSPFWLNKKNVLKKVLSRKDFHHSHKMWLGLFNNKSKKIFHKNWFVINIPFPLLFETRLYTDDFSFLARISANWSSSVIINFFLNSLCAGIKRLSKISCRNLFAL